MLTRPPNTGGAKWSEWLDKTLTQDLEPLFRAHNRAEELAIARQQALLRAKHEQRSEPKEPSATVALLFGLCGGLLLNSWIKTGRVGP